VDELCNWSGTEAARKLWESLSTSAAKLAEARLLAISTPSDPTHWTKRIYDFAEGSELWSTATIPGPVDWLDPRKVEEARQRLAPSSFARLFLCEWASSEDRLATVDDLRACVSLEGPQPFVSGREYVVAADLGVVRDRSVAMVVHREPIGAGDVAAAGDDGRLLIEYRIVLDRVAVWHGTPAAPVQLAEVEGWLEQAAMSYHAGLVLDPWQSIGLGQRLRSRGVRVSEFAFSSSSVARLANTLAGLIRNRALALPPDEELLSELARVRLRETAPGVVRMDSEPGEHDDRAVTLALAAHHLMARPERRAETHVYADRFAEEPVVRRGDMVLRGARYVDGVRS
jgi:hypothetical protein